MRKRARYTQAAFVLGHELTKIESILAVFLPVRCDLQPRAAQAQWLSLRNLLAFRPTPGHQGGQEFPLSNDHLPRDQIQSWKTRRLQL